MKALNECIKNPSDWPHLAALNFNRNPLKNEGISELATALYERFEHNIQDSSANQRLLPVDKL